MLTFYSIGIAVLALLDQLSKWAVLCFVKPESTIPLWEHVFHLTYCENRGAAFGILQGQFDMFFLVTALVVIVATWFIFKKRPKQFSLNAAITLLVGGALGNFIDRLFRGFVVDFLDFRLIHFPIFNLADCFVVAGAILFAAYIIFWDKQETDSDEK